MKEYHPSKKTRDYKVKVTFQFDELITSATCLLRSNTSGVNVLSTFANSNDDDWVGWLKNQHTEKEFELHQDVDELGVQIWKDGLNSVLIILSEDELSKHIVGIEIVEVRNYEN